MRSRAGSDFVLLIAGGSLWRYTMQRCEDCCVCQCGDFNAGGLMLLAFLVLRVFLFVSIFVIRILPFAFGVRRFFEFGLSFWNAVDI